VGITRTRLCPGQVHDGVWQWDLNDGVICRKLNDYVAEGFKTGKFDAVGVTEPQPLMLREQKLARSVFTQTYQAPYNQEYC
jgi:hypothetical protein